MTRHSALRFGLFASLLFAAAPLLHSQEASSTPPRGPAGNHDLLPAAFENLYVPPIPGAPFSGQTIVSFVPPNATTSAENPNVEFSGIVARDSSGRVRFESPRLLPKSGVLPPAAEFLVIDMSAHTRTRCYVETKSCVINATRRVSFPGGEPAENLPAAADSQSKNLGADVMDSLLVNGTRTVTTISPGAVGNKDPIVITKEVWYSPDLQLEVSMIRNDPRVGTQTRNITSISRSEPDPQLFAIPAGFKVLDNRVSASR